jgi:hypoxanthine phosphoribosyltransferase
VSEVATVLHRRDEILRRVGELAEAITRDYTAKAPVLVSVLKGGTIFLADLFRLIDLPVRVDFMSISSYGDRQGGSGVVRVLKDLDHDIGGEHVLVVEDIIDTGLTLSYLLTALRAREPTSIEVCTLLDKSVRRIAPLDIRYRGFDCPDRFVVGYGLDHEERFRNLSMILAVSSPSVLDEHPDALLPFLDRMEAERLQAMGPGGPEAIAAPGQERSTEHR